MNDPRTAGTLRLTAGFLLFKKTGETSHRDLGNIVEWQTNHSTERASRMVSEKGFKRTDKEWTKSIKFGYQFTLDEHAETVLELLRLGAIGSDNVQASGTGATVQFTAALGRSFDLGKRDVSNVVVEISAVAQTEGTDYTVDLSRGIVTILTDGGIAGGATVDVTFDHAANTMKTVASADQVKMEGDFIFDECDQGSSSIRARHTWTGSMFIDNAGNNNLDAPNQVTVQVVCHTKPTVLER